MFSIHSSHYACLLKRVFMLTAVSAVLTFAGYNTAAAKEIRKKDLKKDVELVTDFGPIVLRLSDETPLNRDNFIRMVKRHELDSLDFYRVIEKFLIQTGKDSIADAPALIPAEFRPDLFHQRGAVNAAREGDDVNPKQASANLHFTIIQGKVQNDSTLQRAEERINDWRAYNQVINDPTNAELFKQLQSYSGEGANADSLKVVQDKLNQLAKAKRATMDLYVIPEEHREVYKTKGGAPHLDQNYTVFGQVISGMDLVDRIAAVKTDEGDKPFEKVYIIKAQLIKR
ncbi:peptidylprolyl isomerase [Mangrovibacterium lignilyticum]|uniref:peptidylprolyl isomerase n=1 Tax=Mangrovibacterium lignilyticum TaxID=2668052 RepID=UPI0013D7F5D4|nr:peptidylprolyl isomerase [Mangrovibacterium lignilyticum]